MNEVQPFYQFRCEAGDDPTSAELLIFDVIGNWEEFGEISAKAFHNSLSSLPKSIKRLDIHINSPGGSLTEAQAIYSRLADHRSEKIVYIDGVAASAASIVAMVGHKIYIRSNANIMIHQPSGIAIGTVDDMRKMITALDSLTESMLNVYERRTKQPRGDLREMLAAESWFDAQSAVDKGFADEVRGVVKAAAMVKDKYVAFGDSRTIFDLSRFHNVPAFSATTQEGVTTMAEPNPQPTPPTPTPEPTPTPTPPPKPTGTNDPPAPAPNPDPPPPPPQPVAVTEFDKGVNQERARIAALQKYDKPATHDLIVKAIADGKTVADITDDLFAALERTDTQTARRTDAAALDGIPGSDGGAGTEAANEFGGRLKKAVKARLKARGSRFPVQQGRN